MKALFAMLLCFSAFGAEVYQYAPTQATYLQITDGSYLQEAQMHVYCLPLKHGQVVSVYAQAEITNPNAYNVGIGSVIKAWDYHVDDGVSTWIRTYDAIPRVMSNVTVDTHHMVINKAMADTVVYQGNATHRCYTLVLWAVSSHGTGIINVEQDYGYLQVLVH